MSESKEKLSQLMTSIIDSYSKNDIGLNHRELDVIKFREEMLKPFSLYSKSLIFENVGKRTTEQKKLIFLFAHSDYVQNHFRVIIRKHCKELDRPRVYVYLLTLLANKFAYDDLEFFYVKNNTLSHSLNEEFILGFFDAIYDLYFGASEKYILCLTGNAQSLKSEAAI